MAALYPDAAVAEKPQLLGIVIGDLYTYFMVFVVFSGAAAAILFLLSKRLQKLMNGIS